MRAGQALRGSSEFHAWGDSNLYLRRLGTELTLTVEHRAAVSMPMVALELGQRGEALALQVRADSESVPDPTPTSVDERIVSALSDCERAAVPGSGSHCLYNSAERNWEPPQIA